MAAGSAHMRTSSEAIQPLPTKSKTSYLLNAVLSQETDNPLTCRMELCRIHPDERDPGSFPKQKEDIKAQMLHTRTRYTATSSFKEISLSDCEIDGILLPILLMSKEHHKDKNVKWHCISRLAPAWKPRR